MMATTLRHRGPDDQGVWTDPKAGVGLSHCRLAIQDLSSEGHQPMHSADGRYVLVFNGEIYNFRELRARLEKRGCAFRGHSDTEVMLAAICEFGLESALESFLGMFAFALWDRRQRRLHLVRDRAGEKPLYYGWSGGVFIFGSELKALRAHPQWRGELDSESLNLFMRHNYIPSPHSIYRNIFKLSPGSMVSTSAGKLEAREMPAPKKYWSLWSAAQQGVAHPFSGAASDAIEHLSELLSDSIRLQMVADVPIGAFLSGGIDSSAVVALMQRQSPRQIKTFSIGFGENEFDEAPFAKAVASYLGTQHTELYIHANTVRQAIPRLAAVFDEPFADTSHLPTLLLCELARKQVTVCLSGDAGDELFAGYGLYRRTQQFWKLLDNLPNPLRRRLANVLNRVAANGVKLQNRLGRDPNLFERLLRLSELLPVSNDRELYQKLISSCRDPHNWLREGKEDSSSNGAEMPWDLLPGLLERMTFWDFVTYLPDEVLVKVDRAAMSVSLETRIPLLDRRIIEFAWSLPLSFKQRRGHGKWLLRQMVYQYVPQSLLERPKQGFAAPVEEWIRGELRPWAEELLAETSLRQNGVFYERKVRQKWTEHVSRKRNWGRPLWNVLMLQSWLEAQRTQTTTIAPDSRSSIPRIQPALRRPAPLTR